MAEKLYYSMGEVTEMFDVEASLIRYWCSQFSCLRPKRNSKGNRMFTQQDLDRLKRIYHLLKEKKMTIEGAQKAMKKRVIEAEANDSDVALLERLQSLRASLVEMRDSIAELAENVEPESSSTDTSVAAATENEPAPKKKRTPRRKLIGEEGVVETPLFPFYEQRLF
ncbi:MAG: MerR family transcriptional regulator [Alistipes sp.]|nr:MerR family transcriptional regulator [Alistipes sp.]